ncbi:MAG: polyprenyl synthetase family protein [Mariprofundaceae bacterium]
MNNVLILNETLTSVSVTVRCPTVKNTEKSDSPLVRAHAVCQTEMQEVNACIRQHLSSDVSMVPAVGHYIIESGGKRLRPLLSILSARLFGYTGKRHIPLGVVVEFLHTASLLHDDVVDEAALRRGYPSANGVWGNQASVLVGDFLFSRSFQMMVQDGCMGVLELFARAANTLAEGELLQLSRTFHLGISEAEYMEVIERKTAVLFAAAAEIGARVSGRDEWINNMSGYGRGLGLAFQLADDALDYVSEADAVGKPVGHDLEQGRMTLPLIYAMSRDAGLAERVKQIGDRRGYAEGEFQWLRQRVQDLGGVDYCLDRAAACAEEAKNLLPEGEDASVRQLMADLADFAGQRVY